MALAMLTAVLLPPISITDDLHACQLPAEIKRSVVKGNRSFAPVGPPSILPFLLALTAFCLASLRLRRVSLLTMEDLAPSGMHGHLSSSWSRPPPVSAV